MPAANKAYQATFRNSSPPAAPTDLFSAEAYALEHPPDGGLADQDPASPPQELTSIREGRRRSLFEIFLQEPPGGLTNPLLRAWALLWHQEPALGRRGDVALDGGDTHTEGPGSLALGGHAPLDGCHDLRSEVLRAGFHAGMMPRPIPLRAALAVLC